MTALTGKSPAATYKDLLQVSNGNSGIDGALRPVEDGEGTPSALLISAAAARVAGPLDFAGTTHAGVTLNNLTTAQRDALAPARGMAIFNTTTNQQETYNGAAWVSGGAVSSVLGRTGAVAAQAGDYSIGQISGAAAVASSGSYADLTNRPTLGALAAKNQASLATDVTGSLPAASVSGLAAVASSGSYADLSNKPSLAAYARLDAAQSFTRQQNTAPAALADAPTIAWDLDLAQAAAVTLGGNRALANPANIAGGSYVLAVRQDATGNRTLSYGTAFKWVGGLPPVLSAAANATDLLFFYSPDGAALLGGAHLGFA